MFLPVVRKSHCTSGPPSGHQFDIPAINPPQTLIHPINLNLLVLSFWEVKPILFTVSTDAVTMSAVKMSGRHLFFIFLSTLTSVVYGDTEDLYSSTYQMSRLLSAEIKFVEALKSYAESTEPYSEQIKKFVTDVYADYKPGKLSHNYKILYLMQCKMKRSKLIFAKMN